MARYPTWIPAHQRLKLPGLVIVLAVLIASSVGAFADEKAMAAPVTANLTPVAAATPLRPQSAERDASLRAMLGRWVIIELEDGRNFAGRIVAFDATWVTVALALDDEVMSLPREHLAYLREWSPTHGAGKPLAADIDEADAAVVRHLGLHFGLVPSLMVDIQYDWFYGFANLDILMPVILADEDGLGITGGLGGGITQRLSASSRWYFDAFGQLVSGQLLAEYGSLGFGLGVGFHYTFPNGFAVTFKLPVLGYAGCVGRCHSTDQGLQAYFADALLGTPVVSFGHRF